MKTLRQIQSECDAAVLDQIKRGHATPEMRQAYGLTLKEGNARPLAAAQITTQTDWIDPQPTEKRHGQTQTLLF
jgi:hypothetical protein